ncbi:LrgB family protein [Alkalihalobacillus oceani]|uniref:LrgB family protein n=1 Tax=Halalkalibacter oceani TaxID=1653776 RepID=UPI00203B240F|nr:LrgB family protein [Halalkalibacter oceani]MCM3759580.1 LrgB family protein [Halalkalibacter oceani]
MLFLQIFLSIFATVVVYIGAKALYRRFPYPFMLPVLVSTIVLIFLLLLFQISFETYYTGGQWLEKLLGPGVVALAYPLYKQMKLLRSYFWPIVISVFIGAVIGMTSGLLLTKWGGFEAELVYTMVPKSVTAPVAMDMATTLGGISPLAAVLVMVAGVGGSVFAPYCFRWFNIKNEVSKGVAIGSASHAIGTAKAIENSEREGAASSVAMTLSAIIVSVIGPMLVFLFY